MPSLLFATLIFGAHAFRVPGVPDYDMTVDIQPAARHIAVEGTVTLPPQSGVQSKIYFQLGKQMHDVRFRLTEPAASAGDLRPVMDGDNTLGSANYSADLVRPVDPGKPIKLRFSYEGGEKTDFVFHIGSEGTYGCGSDFAWYPEFGPATATPKLSVDGVSNVVGHVAFTIPEDMQMTAVGKASHAAVSEGKRSIAYDVLRPCALSFAVDHFHVIHTGGAMPIALYFKSDFPDQAKYAEGIQSVVDELTKIYGPFPFPEFGLVEVNNAALKDAGFGGAGCAGFMLSATSFLSRGFNLAFFGHEIGHQWWGNEVTHAAENVGGDILDEAMAQYGSLVCVERLQGAAKASQYRKSGYPGYVPTQNGGAYLQRHLSGPDHRLLDMPDTDPLSHELADEKGFLVFDQLRRELGDDVFHHGLQNVTKDYAFRSIKWSEFCQEIERTAGRKLDWFWTQWFDQTGAPTLGVTWKQQGDEVVGTVTQKAPFYRLHVPIALRLDNGAVQVVRVDSAAALTPFSVKAKGRVIRADVDPDFEILHYTAN